MPFVTVQYPTLGIPLLQSILKQRGIDCSAFYFAELFKDACSLKTYELISTDSGDNELGDWFFSRKTFQLENGDYLNKNYTSEVSCLLDLRNKFESIIDDLSCRDWNNFDVIGFSSTFLQLMPSLCLSKEIKKKHPNTEIIFGGGNMLPDLSKEVLKNCSWVDKIFIGEAEKSLPYYLETGETDTKGIMLRSEDGIKFSETSKLNAQEIQNLPIPDYDDYYRTATENQNIIAQIGRGCIYNKCNFCVYCDHSAYRKGSIKNSMKQLEILVKKYDIKNVAFIDLIMPPNAFKYLPKIPVKYTICISSFTWSYDHLPYLKDQECILGIESFHPNILKLLNKEQSIIKCISMLKWLKHYNSNVSYLLLYGAINEEGKWYDEMLPLLKKLTHLPPPRWCTPINHHRDSTYLTDKDYKECSVYKTIFPRTFNPQKMARIFEVDNADISIKQIKNWTHIKPVINFTQKWKTEYLTQSPCLRRRGNTVFDTRNGSDTILLSQSQIDILEQCNYPVNKEQFIKYNSKDINVLLKKNLLLSLEGQYLSLIEPDCELISI